VTPRTITATYRLQLTRAFTLASARAVVPYLHDLGVSHLYLSPLLAARPGSLHGYDVVDHGRLNPELGDEDELRALAADLHARGMGIVLDIVPHHMAAAWENAAWRDLLERGRDSRFGSWFDVDWDAPRAQGRVVLPVLGDELDRVIERGELRLDITDSGARLAYMGQRFPLDPATLPAPLQLAQLDPAGREAALEWARDGNGTVRLRELLDRQHYRLVHWRRAPADLNYRRFFDVNDLVALRMETEEVFDATHRLVLRWVDEGIVDGLRVDHVDGLRHPAWYLARLRREVDARRPAGAPERIAIFVEKILSGDERLPDDWPVDGSTGYEFLNEIEELFIDPAGYEAVAANYRGLRKNPALRFDAVARDGRRKVLGAGLRPDVLRVARAAHAWRPAVSLEAFAHAIMETIAHLDVYRTYVVEPGLVNDADRAALSRAFRGARTAGAPADALDALERAFFDAAAPGDSLRADLVLRFQQASGPAAAKGVEDTALYAFVPLVSRNEVGGTPGRSLGGAAARMHERNAGRALAHPRAMLATNTHDTKRSADVRARLDALSFAPEEWSRCVARWRRLTRGLRQTVNGRLTPDTNTEYLYYQTLLGLWPAPRPGRRVDDLPDQAWRQATRERLVAYMLKAAREAKTWTSWTESDRAYEEALDAFVRATLESDEHFLPDVARLTATVAPDAHRISCARVLLHALAPGAPDTYQGDELWNFTLVDPDNRRPVDYERRRRLLGEITPDLVARAFDGHEPLSADAVKLALVATVLRFRRDHPRLVAGSYERLDAGDTVFAFLRGAPGERCIVLARTRPAVEGMSGSSARRALPGELAGPWRSVLTGRPVELERDGAVCTAGGPDLLGPRQPCELLFRGDS